MTMQTLDGIFHALSDPTRRAILARLAQGDANVAELIKRALPRLGLKHGRPIVGSPCKAGLGALMRNSSPQ